MLRRILWNIICIGLIFIAPWWVVFVLGVAGVVIFSWYAEIIAMGVLYDALFGGAALTWHGHLTHTLIFLVPLLVAEAVKRRINV